MRLLHDAIVPRIIQFHKFRPPIFARKGFLMDDNLIKYSAVKRLLLKYNVTFWTLKELDSFMLELAKVFQI